MLRKRTVETLWRRFTDLDSERSSWETTWRAVQENVLPRRGRFLVEAQNRGERRGTRMLDSTALRAADRAAAGLVSGLSSQSQQWVRDDIADLDDPEQDARVWLDRLTEVKMEIFQACGLYTALYEIYREAAVFGTAVWTVHADFKKVLRILPRTCGEYWLGADHNGDATELMCRGRMYADQIMSEFELTTDTAPGPIAQSIRNLNGRDEYDVCEYFAENDPTYEQAPHQKRFDYCHEVFLYGAAGSNSAKAPVSGMNDTWFLRRGGSPWRNFGAVRWSRIGRDAYGRGPGMDALGPSAALQQMKRDYLRAVEFQARPPLQGPGYAQDRATDYRPGSYIPRPKSDQENTISSLFEVRLDLADLSSEMQMTRQEIRELFFNDVLATFLTDVRSGKTATEAVEMSAEKLTLFAPIAGRFIDEALIPINETTIVRMDEVGMFEEGGRVGKRPESLKDREIDYEFRGILAQAQKAVQLGQLDRFVLMVTDYVNRTGRGNALDRIDDDELVDEALELIGAPARIVKPTKATQAEREKRAAEAEAARFAATAKDGAAAAKALADAPVGTDERGDEVGALGALMRGAGRAA